MSTWSARGDLYRTSGCQSKLTSKRIPPASGVASGWLPGCLSAKGRQQALLLGGRRRDKSLAAVFTSDLRRAVETAELAFSGVDRMRTFLDDLARDWNHSHVLVIGHAATRFALQHLLEGQQLEDVVNATFDWQPGWHYRLV
jgi:2,3-bisphosphoglycerate-dependent phosphoglycerate mutase